VTVELPVIVLSDVVDPLQYEVTVVVARDTAAFCFTEALPLAAPAFVTVALPEEAAATDELLVMIMLEVLEMEELVVEDDVEDT